MGDIKPKPKRPQPDPAPGPAPNPIQDSALGEAPGESVTMPDIAGWNAEAPEPTPAPKGYFPPVDLIGAWRAWAEAARQAEGAAAPEAAPPPAAPAEQPSEGFHLPVSNRLLIALTTLGVLVVAGLGGSYYLFFRGGESPEQRPVAVTTPRATPTPTPRPSFRPTFRPSPRPTPGTPGQLPGQPAPSGQRTYTVVAGDTLITIGDRFGVDWRQIAAANGQIADPNLIYPGQVLKIP